MKRSRKVEIALVAGLAMSGCGRRSYDPCQPQTFNAEACQDAVSHNGYYYGGHWYPHVYSGGYSAYYNNYYSYVRGGGKSTPVPASEWTRPSGSDSGTPGGQPGAKASSPAAGDSSVSHGVFGSSAHGSGGEGGE